MNIPNFHDGHLDGLRIVSGKEVRFFLRTADGSSYILTLQGVDALTLSEVKQGNVILDLVFRSDRELASLDVEELYGVKSDSPQALNLLNAKRDKGLQIMEINSSYGARGLVLFNAFEICPSTSD